MCHTSLAELGQVGKHNVQLAIQVTGYTIAQAASLEVMGGSDQIKQISLNKVGPD